MRDETDVVLASDDLPLELIHEFEVGGKEYGIAIDIETTGLNPQKASIEVISVATPTRAIVVTLGDKPPHHLVRLLADGSIPKIVHHALFESMFFASQWRIVLTPVFCTKVAARIVGIARNPTLEFLAREVLGVSLDKGERLSDWSRRPLTLAQTTYAAGDVIHLHDLERQLSRKLTDLGLTEQFASCMAFLPTRVELGLQALDDVFAYELPELDLRERSIDHSA